MSCCQACWMEELSIYDCKFIYVKGEDNSMADSLSHFPFTLQNSSKTAETFTSHPYLTLPSPSSPTPLLKHPPCSPFTSITALISSKPAHPHPTYTNNSAINVQINDLTITKILEGYKEDPWCKKLFSATAGMPNLNQHFIIPNHGGIREDIFRLAHNTLGHFGFRKMYDTICQSYFWPNMRKDLQDGYIPSCIDCQHNKSINTRPVGPLQFACAR